MSETSAMRPGPAAPADPTPSAHPDQPSGSDQPHPLFSILEQSFHVPPEKLAPHWEALQGNPLDLAYLKQVLQRGQVVTEVQFQQALAQLFDLEYAPHLDKIALSKLFNLEPDDAQLAPEFTKHIPIRYAKKFVFCPIRMTDDTLWIAVENPRSLEPVKDVGHRFNRQVRHVVSTHQSILSLINQAYKRSEETTDEVIEGIDTGQDSDWAPGIEIDEPEDLIDVTDEEPIKRLLNNILYQAAKNDASDIHIEANPGELIVRFRVDGVLRQISALPKDVQQPLLNRVKIMSRLDISQHGLPQDGRTLILIAGRKIDIRVSTLPTVHGEKCVLRLLYQDHDRFGLRQLGMPEAVHQDFSRLLKQSGGVVLVSGPTGSGKTTTLYAALTEIDRHSKNIMTIEDPVEYKVAGYVQTEVNPKLGLTFANALRAVLRQDPDVIMVGEIRDQETAEIAIQAALTGHTVFSTVHTNDAPSTVTRLIDMGVEPYLISSSLVGVLAQRLVRRLCLDCSEVIPRDAPLLRELGLLDREIEQLELHRRASGCPQCQGTGYRGRIGLFELLLIDEAMKKILQSTNEANKIREAAQAQGMITLRESGFDMVRQGITTVDELLAFTRED